MAKNKSVNTTRSGPLLAAAIAAVAIPTCLAQESATLPGGSLNPNLVPKYVAPLVKPPEFPRDRKFEISDDRLEGYFKNATRQARAKEGKIEDDQWKKGNYYEIAVRQFTQQILPTHDLNGQPIPETTVWSYGPESETDPDNTGRHVTEGGHYFYPAFTIEAEFMKPTQVKWINGLVDANGNPLPHLLPVDPTLHWANPIGERDRRPPEDPNDPYWSNPHIQYTDVGAPRPVPMYYGPVPTVSHVHGAHTTEDSDGYPEAWFLPAAAYNDPAIVSPQGTFYDFFNTKYNLRWKPGSSTYTYPNDQRATTLWYHDHTLGMTRVNVYAGPAGFYIISGGADDQATDSRTGRKARLPGPRAEDLNDIYGDVYDIPLVIQDRSFNADGSLFYPDNRAFFEGLEPHQLDVPVAPEPGIDGRVSDVSPVWQPEFFGNVIVVNGQSWPFLDTEQRRYRFRLLNGADSRFLILDFTEIPGVKVWQIGADGGFLQNPVDITSTQANRILMGPAERADVIVDFTNVPAGNYRLLNVGPDEPFGGGQPGVDFFASDPETTGQVMLFRVTGPAKKRDRSTPPEFLQLPVIEDLAPTGTRMVSLNEMESNNVFVEETIHPVTAEFQVVENSVSTSAFGPTAAMLGTVNPDGSGKGLMWMDPITENPMLGDTETWEIYNYTMDAHPIHIHLVQFQVVNRESETGGVRQPEPTEIGWKDTVISYPGEITRVKMRFDLEGLYVWHCHILEHEDNEMMRPYYVGPINLTLPVASPKEAEEEHEFRIFSGHERRGWRRLRATP